LTYHNSREDALIEELKIQIELDVVKSVEYMNESFARVNGFFGRDISGENHPNYGKNHSEETKKKISAGNKGKKHSAESKKKNSDAHKGKKVSEETLKKMSDARKDENNPRARKIRAFNTETLEEIIFLTVGFASKYFNKPRQYISNVILGKRKNKLFPWTFAYSEISL
jgi:hypothetical protein